MTIPRSYDPDIGIELERNPNFWKNGVDGRPLPYFDQVTLASLEDPNRNRDGLSRPRNLHRRLSAVIHPGRSALGKLPRPSNRQCALRLHDHHRLVQLQPRLAGMGRSGQPLPRSPLLPGDASRRRPISDDRRGLSRLGKADRPGRHAVVQHLLGNSRRRTPRDTWFPTRSRSRHRGGARLAGRFRLRRRPSDQADRARVLGSDLHRHPRDRTSDVRGSARHRSAVRHRALPGHPPAPHRRQLPWLRSAVDQRAGRAGSDYRLSEPIHSRRQLELLPLRLSADDRDRGANARHARPGEPPRPGPRSPTNRVRARTRSTDSAASRPRPA